MRQENYRRINWYVEALIILMIFSEIMLVLLYDAFYEHMGGIIVQIVLYVVLSIVFYYSLSPAVLFAKSSTPVRMKQVEIPEELSKLYLKKAVAYISITKLSILTLFFAIILSVTVFNISPFFFVAIDLFLVFFFIFLFTKYLALSRGYLIESSKDLITNLIFYYNPEDKRAVVDKPVGLGSTINLATKQGRIILITILGIPLIIVLTLLLVLTLSGKF